MGTQLFASFVLSLVSTTCFAATWECPAMGPSTGPNDYVVIETAAGKVTKLGYFWYSLREDGRMEASSELIFSESLGFRGGKELVSPQACPTYANAAMLDKGTFRSSCHLFADSDVEYLQEYLSYSSVTDGSYSMRIKLSDRPDSNTRKIAFGPCR